MMIRTRQVLMLVAALTVAWLWQGGGVNFGSVASANQPNSNLEFTLHVNGCTTASETVINCVVPNNVPFVATVSLDAIPGPYDSLGITLVYEGIASKDDAHIVWPDCAGETVTPDNGSTTSSTCSVSSSPSTFTGTVFTTTFNCEFDSSLSIVHGPSDTHLTDYLGKTSTDDGPDVMTIECLNPTDTPTPTETATPTAMVTQQATPIASPTPTRTPGPVGGVALDARSSADGSRSAIELAFAAGALAIVSIGFGVTGWRCRRRIVS
jgi:hypothetical protein